MLGVPVFYADDIAKNVMNADAGLKQNIIQLFGDDAYINNTLNRKYIAGIVFSDKYKLEQLNALVHPVTIAAYDEMTERSYPNYTGGTEEQRKMRDLLRSKMEAQGFTVYEYEWWHFDYKDWKEYRITNVPFSEIR